MRPPAVLSMLIASSLTAVAVAQPNYTFEMRLIADGEPESPGGPTPSSTYPIADRLNTGATRIGFWLQARVSQTVNQNWGIGRASSPADGVPSFITLYDIPLGSNLKRGTVDAAGTQHGRGPGYRIVGSNIGPTGNNGVASYPLTTGANNGGLDGGSDGMNFDRIYGFNAFIGHTKLDFDADGDGIFHNPWTVNGAPNPQPNTDPAPVQLNQFSPWANLYRFWVDDIVGPADRIVTISASALLQGAIQIAPTGFESNLYAWQAAVPGVLRTCDYTFRIGTERPFPTPYCPAADVGTQGGVVGHDLVLDNNDFIVFINLFFIQHPTADLGIQGGLPGTDGRVDNNDFVVFINLFFTGC